MKRALTTGMLCVLAAAWSAPAKEAPPPPFVAPSTPAEKPSGQARQVRRLNLRLFDLLEGKFGAEDWFPLLRDRANLTAESLTTKTLAEFDRLCQFTVGNVIYHPAGWGEYLFWLS